eukprot:Mycagemm_TRINITY_DN10290_c0_g13::TRINITY_DN10290_c0_g13_i1::g.3855::m.3855 type:complete len:182 gc:universal TRINITY_DN10290_c0_g13_i1:611-66(-)
MHPAAAAILAEQCGTLGNACWDLRSGQLCGFDEPFLNFADMKRSYAFGVERPTWIDALSGKDGIFLKLSTKKAVEECREQVLDIEDSFREGRSSTQVEAEMLFVTRVGRQKARLFSQAVDSIAQSIDSNIARCFTHQSLSFARFASATWRHTKSALYSGQLNFCGRSANRKRQQQQQQQQL